jgi:hypothetical protein
VLLYHFTTVWFLRPDGTPGPGIIPPEGLIGGKGVGQGGEILKTEGVWLTADPVPGQAAHGNCVRITVKIPTTDRKLVRYRRCAPVFEDLLRRDHGWDHPTIGVEEAITRVRRDWWLYFGAISPECWVAIDILDRQCPWWLVKSTPQGKTKHIERSIDDK